MIDGWRQRAQVAQSSGDLASAEISWHVLTLLAPEDPSYRRELADTRAALRRELDDTLQAARAALRANDADRASALFLRALALDPENTDAARALRELDRRRLARSQATRTARSRADDPPLTARAQRAAAAETSSIADYDLEQRLELFNAGDTNSGLRELRSWVDAHPQDRAGRQRVAAVVFDRGADLERRGAREEALPLYEAAIRLRGDPATGWPARVQGLRKTLSNEYFDRGTRALHTDLEGAVKALETSVRYDPSNVKASARLAQAKTALARFREIEGSQRK